jgi:hypothetical protein
MMLPAFLKREAWPSPYPPRWPAEAPDGRYIMVACGLATLLLLDDVAEAMGASRGDPMLRAVVGRAC